MAAEIENLSNDIGLPVEVLRKMLPHDEPCIARLIESGYSREHAEEISFIGDLRNVLDMMSSDNFSAKTAAYILRQDSDVPVYFDSTDEEDEDKTDSSKETGSASSAKSSSSNSSSNSEDERKQEAKRIKLDPDFVPSATTSEDSSTANTTANNSVVTTEVEETETETEEEEWEPSESTEDEKERSEEEEEDN
jgi:hypothetical protein